MSNQDQFTSLSVTELERISGGDSVSDAIGNATRAVVNAPFAAAGGVIVANKMYGDNADLGDYARSIAEIQRAMNKTGDYPSPKMPWRQ